MTAVFDSRSIPAWWKTPLLVYGLAIAAFLLAYFDTFAVMVYTWWHFETYTHGLLIIPIAAYLVWDRRSELQPIHPKPFGLGLFLIFVSCLGWFASNLAGIQMFMQIFFFAIWISLTLTILGAAVFKQCAFPLFYLLFAVPFGEQFVPAMMDFTADFAIAALHLTNIPFYSEGRFIYLPTGNWEVAEACSGVRYIIASVALGVLYAYWSYQKLWKRLLFVSFSVLVPILANGLRAFGIILLGHFSGMTLAVGVDHLIYGWLFFGLVMFLLFWLGAYWRDDRVVSVASAGPEDANINTGPEATRLMMATLLSVAIIISGPSANVYVSKQFEATQYASSWPVMQVSWQGPETSQNPWNPHFPGASLLELKVYRSSVGSVTAYLVHYGAQRQGEELINQTNSLFDRKRWRVVSGDASTVGLQSFQPFHIEAYKSSQGYRVVAWAYDVGAKRTTHGLMVKWRELLSVLSGDLSGSYMIGFSADHSTSLTEADRILQSFLTESASEFRPGQLIRIDTEH